MKNTIKESLNTIRLIELDMAGGKATATDATFTDKPAADTTPQNQRTTRKAPAQSPEVKNSRFRNSGKLSKELTAAGVPVVKDTGKAAATVAAKVGGSALSLFKRVIPGVGLVVGTQDAIARAQRGDWAGAGVAGLAAVLSLAGPVGIGASLGLDAYNMYRDYSSKEGEKPEGSAETPAAPESGPVATQSTKGDSAPDPAIKAVQDKILAKDPNALPKHGADGRMGSETQAAMAKYIMSTESQQTVAEGIRSLQERIDLIEAKAVIREGLEQTYFLDKNYFMYDKSGEQVVDLLTISVINEAHEQGQIKIKKLS